MPDAGDGRIAGTGIPHYRPTYVVLAVALLGYGLMQTLVIPVLPSIQAGLHTTQGTATWILTSYLLSASVCTPILGRLGDMWGRDRVLTAALGALTVGTCLGALATHVSVMLVARAIQGAGGGILPLSFGIIRDQFPEKKVATAVGTVSGLAAAGSGFGIVIGGPIVEALDFHWLFWIPAIVLAAGTVAAHIVVPPTPGRTGGRINWLAVTLLSGWLLAVLVGISQAPTWGWGSARVLALLAVGIALAATWVFVESRAANPLVDMRLMRMRGVWTTNLVALLLGVGLYGPFAFIPEFLQTRPSAGYGFGVSVTVSGLILLPASLFAFVLGMLSGRLALRYGSRTMLVCALSGSVVSYIILSTHVAAIWQIVLALSLNGGSVGLAFASLSTLVVQGVPASQTGVATGMNANIRTIGGALGTAVIASIVTSGVHAGALPPEHNYLHGFAAVGVAVAVAVLLATAVPRPRPTRPLDPSLLHPELGMVAGGTLAGDDPE